MQISVRCSRSSADRPVQPAICLNGHRAVMNVMCLRRYLELRRGIRRGARVICASPAGIYQRAPTLAPETVSRWAPGFDGTGAGSPLASPPVGRFFMAAGTVSALQKSWPAGGRGMFGDEH